MSTHFTSHSRPHSPGLIGDLTQNANLGEDIELVVGVTAAALTADQLYKLMMTKKHKTMHLVKAGLSATVAGASFAMMLQEHHEHEKKGRERGRSRYRNSDFEPREDKAVSYHGRNDHLADDDDYDEALVRARPSRRGASYDHYSHRERSLSPTLSPPRRRARSQSLHHHKKRGHSTPGLFKFIAKEVVRNLGSSHTHYY
ncbi:hypothetical protein B0T25DRAFT_69632 [Lasiosphaeria hispida]|uniref:Uncharacterized protein n=1 Tax=Lasiosphaeria hispida TaxID=260671 RepID=A0AAJ0HXV7_9PEZI|nr:hypothetical protein B0T25DRAFT_69632 [Lasiosphaeria hispida]